MYWFRKGKVVTGYFGTKIRRFVKKLNIFFKKWVFCKEKTALWAAGHRDLSPARASGAIGSFERGIFRINEHKKWPQADACGHFLVKYRRKITGQNR